jgi:phosphoribosyl-dephospho-CoA transferase
MSALQRNSLAWLNDSAWAQVRAREWDSQAQDILVHWQAQNLPVVLCAQRLQQTPPTVSLGLPAPIQWGRRKLAFEVAAHDIACVNTFPSLASLAQAECAHPAVFDILHSMQAHPVSLHVYGSFGWQHLTGLTYVHPTSDLDVIAMVSDTATATEVARTLQALSLLLPLSLRLDGELAFPGGGPLLGVSICNGSTERSAKC